MKPLLWNSYFTQFNPHHYSLAYKLEDFGSSASHLLIASKLHSFVLGKIHVSVRLISSGFYFSVTDRIINLIQLKTLIELDSTVIWQWANDVEHNSLTGL